MRERRLEHFIALICLFTGFLVANADYVKEEQVFVLTDANFDDFLVEHPTVLVEFYAPWCVFFFSRL